MANTKRSRLTSMLRKSSKQRRKARKGSTTPRLSSEALEDRNLLAADLTFSPNGFFATGLPNNEFQFNALDFLPGNLVVEDLDALVSGNSTRMLYQAKLGLFTHDGNPVPGTGLNSAVGTAGNGYEVTAVFHADVISGPNTGGDTLNVGTGTLPENLQLVIDPNGTANVEFYIDDNIDPGDGSLIADNLSGTGFNDGYQFMTAELDGLTTDLHIFNNGSTANLDILDKFSNDDFAGQQTVVSSGNTSAQGTVTSTNNAYLSSEITVFDFDLDLDSTTSTPFQQVNPSRQFQGLLGSAPTPAGSAGFTPYTTAHAASPSLQTPNGTTLDGATSPVSYAQFQADASASFNALGSISGEKFHDLDADGIRDAGEPNLANVTINLVGQDADGNAVVRTATTDANGQFIIDDLPEGNFTVSEVVPTGFFNSTPIDVNVSLALNEDITGITFGNYQTGTIHGLKYHDLNENGVQDAGELPLSGVVFTISGNGVTYTVTSDANGEFWSPELHPGSYTITETVPAGFEATTSTTQTIDVTSGFDNSATPTEFGNVDITGTIHGLKFHDLNEDGDQDAGELPMSGVQFTIEGTGGTNYGPVTLTSNADGEFWSEKLLPGTYTVTETVPDGFFSTTSESQTIEVTRRFNNSADPVLFGNAEVPVYGSIHGFKCEDVEADGSCTLPVVDADAHIVFVVDYSGSTKDIIDGQTVLQHEIDAIEATLNSFNNLGLSPEIGVVGFNESYLLLEMNAAGDLFTTSDADADGNGTLDVIDALQSTTQADVYNNGVPGPAGGLTGGASGPLTNYKIALEGATELLSQWNVDPAEGNVAFISDGVPTIGDTGSNLLDEVADLSVYADTIRAFGINTADLANLQPIDPMAQIYTNPAMLLNIFSFFGSGGAVNNPAMAGITFELLDADGDAVLDSGGDPIQAVTDENGEFWFTDIKPGTYKVREVLPPFGHFVTTTHSEMMFTITSGEEYVWQTGAAKLGSVEGRHIFYNGSAWDGDGTALSAADDAAIAPDKSAYIAGSGSAGFSNYTSYDDGINGIMVDLNQGMAATGIVSLADFEFRFGNDNNAAAWAAAPTPTMSVRAGAGVNGSDRYSFSWPNGTLSKGWLQVTVKANANTGIQMDDIHYWGNAVGETLNMVGDTMVNAADVSGIVNNPTGFSFTSITDAYDVNRDKLVNAADISVVVNNPANGFTVPDLELLNNPTQQTMNSWKKEILVGNDLIFGNHRLTASIHGFKFEDDFVDGVYDPLAEGGMPDIEFGLYDTSDNPILDADGNHLVAVSGADGEFWFDNLPLNLDSATTTYRVTEHGHTNPAVAGDVFASTHDSVDVVLRPGEEAVWYDATTGMSGSANLGPFEYETLTDGLIFGNYVTASVHGIKYMDVDMDGFYDPSIDEPWGGWTFILESDHDGDGQYGFYEDVNLNGILDPGEDLNGDGVISGDPDCTETTKIVTSDDLTGEFWFLDLCPCHYRLTEVNPFSDVFPTPMTDSDMDGTPDTQSKTAFLNLQSGDEAVWRPGAAMLPDVTLKEEAFYDGPGTLEMPGNGIWDSLAFGNFAFGSIHGFKYQDSNVDGQYNPDDGDTPLGGVKFELEAADGTITEGFSNPNGEFWFENLKPGEYTVREILDHNIWNTTPLERTITVGVGEEHVWAEGAAHLPEDTGKVEVLADLSFGNAISGSIHGLKFNDYDGDGIYEPNSDPDPNDGRDQNDHPIEGFVFQIIGDVDGDGSVDSDIFVTTDANGEFWLEGLYPGEYTVRERIDMYTPAGHQDDFVPTTHPLQMVDGVMASQYTINVGSGMEWAWAEGRAMLEPHELQTEYVDSKLAFGNSLLGSVHGCVYNDANGNGMFDVGETVQGGVEVQLTNTDTGQSWTEVTWLDGLFWFDHDPSRLGVNDVVLVPGNYELTAINLPAGWAISTGTGGVNSFFLGSGEEIVHEDGAAHLDPALDPQHEVILPGVVLIGVVPPAPAFLPVDEVELVEASAPVVESPVTSRVNSGRVQLIEASLLSYVSDRDNLSSGEDASDDENDELFAALAQDRWFL